jgi:adenosylcobinamide-phosphate synthase
MVGLDITPELTWVAIGTGPEPLFLLLAALALDAALGVILRRLGRPFDRVAAQFISEVVRRLGQPDRSFATHLIRGLLLGLFLIALGGGGGVLVAVVAAAIPVGWTASLVTILVVIDQRTIFAAFGRSTGAACDDTGRRQSVESAALRYAEGAVALAFWYVLLGVAGMLIYRLLLVAALLFERPGADDRGLGFVCVRLHEAAGWIPLRLAGLLLSFAAAFTPGASLPRALAAIFSHTSGRRLRSAAWPVAATAGALGIVLVGPRHLDGADRGVTLWIEPVGARAQVTPNDTRRAYYLLIVACVLSALVVLLVAMVELVGGAT